MTYKKPKRIFEGSGEVNVEESYYVPLENVTNTNKQDMKTMIDRCRYFSIFAPRQSGKTTFFKETCRQLQNDPTYVAIILSFPDYQDLDKSKYYTLNWRTSSLRELYQQYKSVKQKALYSVGLVGIRNITKLVVGGYLA